MARMATFRQRPASSRALWLALAMLAAAGGTCLVYFVDPRVPGNYPPCLFLFFTGCYCPGCGTLRALHRLLHGDLPGALGYNPLSILLLPFLAATAIVGLARTFGRPLLQTFSFPPRLAWGLLAVVVLFWTLRNVPAYPLTVLAP